MRTIALKMAHHAIHHLHEIAPAIVLEYPHITLGVAIILVSSLMIVFGLQLITEGATT